MRPKEAEDSPGHFAKASKEEKAVMNDVASTSPDPGDRQPSCYRASQQQLPEDWESHKNTAPNSHIFPMLLAIMPSYRCTASCEHCCFSCNPNVTHRLSLARILDFMGTAMQYKSISIISFTGGECFLLGQDLNEAITFASRKGRKTRCVTNGYWAKSYAAGRRRLRSLKDAGLNELSLSTGDFHIKHVAFDTVINAIRCSLELDIKTDVAVELSKNRRCSAPDITRHPTIRNLPKDKRNLLHVYESPWMPMSYDETIDQEESSLLNKKTVRYFKGCDSILTTLTLTPSNRIGLCCGLSRHLIPELNVDCQDGALSDILERAGADFLKIWILVDGPERILAWAGSKDSEIRWENRYAHRCHACLALYNNPRVRTVIKQHYEERIGDILMRYCILLRSQECLQGAIY